MLLPRKIEVEVDIADDGDRVRLIAECDREITAAYTTKKGLARLGFDVDNWTDELATRIGIYMTTEHVRRCGTCRQYSLTSSTEVPVH